MTNRKRKARFFGLWSVLLAVLLPVSEASAAETGRKVALADGYLETRSSKNVGWSKLEVDESISRGYAGQTLEETALLVLSEEHAKITVGAASEFKVTRGEHLRFRTGGFYVEKDPGTSDQKLVLRVGKAEFTLHGTVLQLDLAKTDGDSKDQEYTLACAWDGRVGIHLKNQPKDYYIEPEDCFKVFEHRVEGPTLAVTTPGFKRMKPRRSLGVSAQQTQDLLFHMPDGGDEDGGEVTPWVKAPWPPARRLPDVSDGPRPTDFEPDDEFNGDFDDGFDDKFDDDFEDVLDDVTDTEPDFPVGPITISVGGSETPSQ